MKINQAEKYLQEYLKITNPLFDRYIRGELKNAKKVGSKPRKILRDFATIARRGKKIRGSLVVLGYELGGGKRSKEIFDTSLFIELIHAGLLVHDDIQDQDISRRGLPTIHHLYEKVGNKYKIGNAAKHYGESMAINIGATAYFLALDKLFSSKFPPKRLVDVGKLCGKHISNTTYGQILDTSNIFIKNPNQDELLNILKYKTAEYTGVFPLLAGTTLAGLEDEKKLNTIRKYGYYLGWAFQIQDDILGTFGDEKKLGKSIGVDIKEGKVTLLMLHLFEHGRKKDKELLKKLLGKKDITNEEINNAQDVLKKVGSFQYVNNLGWMYVEKGKKLIPQITNDKRLASILDSYISYMMERTL